MKRLLLFTVAFFMAGCATTGEVIPIQIEGVDHIVKRMKSDEFSWWAREKSFLGGFIDPNDFRQNIMAIELVSGCKVDLGTVRNQGLETIARVDCAN
tara:strand:+ start:471 stop:761 length:291 start_codon:yes stop_codon:yes gene_type:complete